MSRYRNTLLMAGLLLTSTPSLAENWKIVGAGNERGETMTLEIDTERSYVLECAPDKVLVTYTGVTDLLDLRSGSKVGDVPGSIMPEGAAMMAVFTGKGAPKLLPAEYKANPARGWDLTLRMAKNDKALNSLEKASIFSLFTMGHTAATKVDTDTRAQFAGFLARCRG